MQVCGLPGHVIRNTVARWRRAMADGLASDRAARAVGEARANLYRWEKRLEPRSRRPARLRKPVRPPGLVEAIERLRLDFPMWGRAKLGPLVREQGSDATVGRIIAQLVARGAVQLVLTLRRRPYARRWTAKRRFAQRLPRDLTANEPGSLVQLDTVHVNVAPDKSIKHFTAYDPIAKWTVAKAFNRATAASAAIFLDKIVTEMPFPVKAIQVDGGSEFMAEFEDACEKKGLRLFVLPPKSPQMNGAVERCNGAWRYEFYAVYDLPTSVEAINPILDSFQHLYNHHRPHGALGGKTPSHYLAQRTANETHPSHMS